MLNKFNDLVLVSLLLTLKTFSTPSFVVSIVDFEYVFVCWKVEEKLITLRQQLPLALQLNNSQQAS